MTVNRLYGAQLIAEERLRILNEEGDLAHLSAGELTGDAESTAAEAWNGQATIEMLVRAGALLALAVDRLMALYEEPRTADDDRWHRPPEVAAFEDAYEEES